MKLKSVQLQFQCDQVFDQDNAEFAMEWNSKEQESIYYATC